MRGAMWHKRRDARNWARRWLFEDALPLWWRLGADHVHGGFHDRIDGTGRPLDLPKSLRVQARQTFVFCSGGRWGWRGPWREAVEHGLAFLLNGYRRPDGLFRALPAPEEDNVDLHDQAFVLFALAAGYRALGSPAALLHEAEALLGALEAELAHPAAGVDAARPRRLPLRANPHMHLLEALLAWVALGEKHAFETKAGELVALALVRLIDPATGAVGEFFDGDWLPAPAPDGLLRQPGHQFQWAYLLHEAGRLLEIDTFSSVERLRHFGNRYGMRDGRAMSLLDAEGMPLDRSSRVWAQSERLRTMLVLGLDGAAAESFALVQRHLLEAPLRGLWRERMAEDGRCIDEPTPASSLYHIVTGFEPLIDEPRGASVLFRRAVFPEEKPLGLW
jgi:mannose/cellobiose epimerase-like protein (N-acyl-D-glucosamine 2-epimerase family)